MSASPYSSSVSAAGAPLNDSAWPPVDGFNLWPAFTSHNASDLGPRADVPLNVDPTNQDQLDDPHGWSGYAGVVTLDGYKLVLGYPGVPDGVCRPNQDAIGIEGTDPWGKCSYNGTVPLDRSNPRLYHLPMDQSESNNLAQDPAYATVLQRLSRLLAKYVAGAVPPLNETPDERKTDPTSSPRLHHNVWTPWKDER